MSGEKTTAPQDAVRERPRAGATMTRVGGATDGPGAGVAARALGAGGEGMSPASLLALQRAAGNRAVTTSVQRKVTASESPDDYADLLTGIVHLLSVVREETVDKTDTVVPLNIAETNAKQQSELTGVHFGSHLSKPHKALLEKVRTAFVQARTQGSERSAATLWDSIQPDLQQVMARAPKYVNGDVGAIQQNLSQVGAQLIHGGAYSAAHNDAVKHLNLADASTPLEMERLKETAESFEELNKFAQKAGQLAAEDVVATVLSGGHVDKETKELAHSIYELVTNPGEIGEKLKEFQEQGKISKAVTVAQLADKMLALRNAVYKVSFEVVAKFAGTAEKAAIQAGEHELAENWKSIAEWSEGKLKMLDRVAKVATVISVVISAIKVVDLLRQGKWGEALREAGSTAVTLAVAEIAGGGGSALVGGIMVMVAAEIQAIHGAADMMRWCEKTNAREAAWSFVNVCTQSANMFAKDLIADAQLLANTTNPTERATIEKNLASYTTYWMRDMQALATQLHDTRASQLGGQPALQAALGMFAVSTLQSPDSWSGSWQHTATQIQIIFAGARAMAEYVAKTHPKVEKAEPKEGEGEGGKKEGGGE